MKVLLAAVPVFGLLSVTPPDHVDSAIDAPVSCSFSPAGPVNIDVGDIATFGDAGCAGLTATISPTTGIAGFSSGTACTKTSVTINEFGVMKVRGCENGSVTVSVWSGGVVIQTITVNVGL